MDAVSLMEADTECPICVDHLVDPLSLGCGHAFCRLCLLQSTHLAPDGRACPLCRQLVGIRDPATHPVDAALEALVRASVGEAAYDKRALAQKARIETFLTDLNTILPIFSMYPGTSVGAPVALHFFEPRFKVLVRRVWEGNRLFVFTAQAPRAGVQGIVVRIDIARFLPDGRANVVGVGVEAVRLGEVWVEEGTGGLHCTRTPVVSVAAAPGELRPASRARSRSNSLPSSAGSAAGRRGCSVM